MPKWLILWILIYLLYINIFISNIESLQDTDLIYTINETTDLKYIVYLSFKPQREIHYEIKY